MTKEAFFYHPGLRKLPKIYKSYNIVYMQRKSGTLSTFCDVFVVKKKKKMLK